jgi:hypothetical protein
VAAIVAEVYLCPVDSKTKVSLEDLGRDYDKSMKMETL